MSSIDPIDTLLEIYDHPIPKESVLPNLDEELILLISRLENFITTHVGTVTNRSQSSIIISAVFLRNKIAVYLQQSTNSTGRGM